MVGQYFFRGCVLDEEARELLRDGNRLELSPKAFDALKILIDARPRAISQRQLYETLWPDKAVEIGNLHNVIHGLRSALGDSERTIIRTVYGYGFAFAAGVTVVERDVGSPSRYYELQIGGESVPLPKGVHVVGRDFDSLIPTTSRSVSRRHARIIVSDLSVTIEDLGSTNGTFVSGERIEAPVALRSGDVIVFGAVLSAIFREAPLPPPTEPAKTEFARTS